MSEIVPDWIKGDGPDADVVISTRARLARSLADYPFPSRASGEDLSMVISEVRGASSGLRERFPKLKLINIDKLGKQEKFFLLDSHMASVEQISGGHGRAIILEPSAALSIMINEEDHIRLQSVASGLACEKAWELVDWADDILAEGLNYGHSGKYGYLTASLSNVGTGLRISTMMHLAGLALKHKVNTQLRAAYDLGVSIRGLFGEGTRWLGDMFQVSNEVTLGISEKEIIERVRSVAQYLLAEERLARKELLNEQRSRLLDIARRSLDTLKSAMSVKPQDAVTHMSPIRLASALGLTINCTGSLMNELLVGMQAGAGDDGGVSIERAAFLRKKLADVHIISG
ncbi:ATP--guanido phosphotransferase [bacterium]|nr:ATP--guanido phosphotransferase [bacterium]